MSASASYKDQVKKFMKTVPLLKTAANASRGLAGWFRKRHLLSQIKKRQKGQAIIFYLMGHGREHRNLGDQAQAGAIPLWLEKHFAGPIIQIKTLDVVSHLDAVVEFIKPGDIVFIHSGGCFGDDWYETQLIREKIFTALSGYRIVQLPQTIHYSETEEGAKRLAISQQLIGNMKSLFLIGRDPESATQAHNYFSTTKISAYPDMVLSLQDIAAKRVQVKATDVTENKQCKCLLILRNDKESVMDMDSKNTLMSKLELGGYDVKLWDTDVDDIFFESRKLDIIIKHLKFISTFDAVVTDRYHGLIFAVLLKRPCVVLPTHNHKLTSAFDWFHKVNFVHLLKDSDDLCESVRKTLSVHPRSAPDWNKEYFDPMAAEIKSFVFNDAGEK